MKMPRAADLGYSVHYLGNPVIERAPNPVPQHSDARIDVLHGETRWSMPNGAMAFRAALVIDAGVDVERSLLALGGVRL